MERTVFDYFGQRLPAFMIHLTQADLKFLVETVATRRQDHDRVIELIRLDGQSAA